MQNAQLLAGITCRFDLYQAYLNPSLTYVMRMTIISIMDLQLNIKQVSHVVRAAPPMRQQKISSQALLGRRGELIIEHGGREYRLRLTQNGKLILTA